MANFFKDLLNKFNLSEDEDDFDDEESFSRRDKYNSKNTYNKDDDDEQDDGKSGKNDFDDDDDSYEQSNRFSKPKKSSSKILHMKPMPSNRKGNGVRVIRPIEYDDAQEISDTIKEGIPVILNLEGINTEFAQKILDFSSGIVYALDCQYKQIAQRIYVITPNGMDILGNFDEYLVNGGIDTSGSSRYV